MYNIYIYIYIYIYVYVICNMNTVVFWDLSTPLCLRDDARVSASNTDQTHRDSWGTKKQVYVVALYEDNVEWAVQ